MNLAAAVLQTSGIAVADVYRILIAEKIKSKKRPGF
jgi:hypothetical protein